MQGSAKSGPRAKCSPQALGIRPAVARQLWHYDRPALSPVDCGMDMAWHFTHTHNQWPWLSEQGTAIWYATLATAISSLQLPHQQQHDSWDSTKWQVGHLTPSFTSRRSRTGTYRLAYTHPFFVNKLERAWLPSSCAPLKEDCCHVWIDLMFWAAVLKHENHQISLPGTAVGQASQPSSFSLLFFIVPGITFLCAEKSQYNSSHWFTVTCLYAYTCFSEINVWLPMAILSVLTCGFYTSPAHGKLVGGPSGPLS